MERHIPEKAYAEQWDAVGLEGRSRNASSASICPSSTGPRKKASPTKKCANAFRRPSKSASAERAANFGPEIMRYVEKTILLQTLDHDWREHIVHLDHLRQYVGLRGYGQRDPLNEYKSEAFALFEGLLGRMRSDVIRQLMHIQVAEEAPPPLVEPSPQQMRASHIDPLTGEDEIVDSLASRNASGWCSGPRPAGRSQQSPNLGQSAAQRALPLRIGPQIQALPRRAGLSRGGVLQSRRNIRDDLG